jgi:hypothetical protein
LQSHLHSTAQRHTEIASAGILDVAVFHSGVDELRPFVAELPFAVVADRAKRSTQKSVWKPRHAHC